MFHNLSWGEDGVSVFHRRCPKCWKFVKADTENIKWFPERNYAELPQFENANGICKVHGKIKLPFEGWFSEEDLT